MAKVKIDTLLIVDKSGSMCGREAAVVCGLNEQLQQARLEADDDTEIRVSLLVFNGHTEEIFWRKPAQEIEDVQITDYKTSGSTLFVGSLGYATSRLKNEIGDDPDHKVMVTIITDGEDTDNHKEFTPEVTQRIVEETQKLGWTYSFIGCSADVLTRLAETFKVQKGNCAVWSNDSNSAVKLTAQNMAKAQGGYYRGIKSLASRGLSLREVAPAALYAMSPATDNELADWSKSSKSDQAENLRWMVAGVEDVDAVPVESSAPNSA